MSKNITKKLKTEQNPKKPTKPNHKSTPSPETPDLTFPKTSPDLEIPLGPRTPKYRFFEILPGALSYFLIILLFILSFINPFIASIYLLIVISITLVKAIGTAYRTVQGFQITKSACTVDWARRLKDLENPHDSYERLRDQYPTTISFTENLLNTATKNISTEYEFDQHLINLKKMSAAPELYPNPSKIYHAIIITVYNEPLEVLIPTLDAIKANQFDHHRIIITIAYEERGGRPTEEMVQQLQELYKKDFYDFITFKHPKNLKNEVIGKGPNLTYAGHQLQKYINQKKLPVENIIVTTLDADNHMHEKYLPCVAYEFIASQNRQHLSYQPVSLFINNIWDAPAPTRIVATSNSFFNTISTVRPHVLRNFASHSQPLLALEKIGFWSRRTIVEDGHQYWRSLFYFNGNYSVLPIRVPIYQDAVIDTTLWKTLKAQFIQLRRWDYGASDVPYVAVRLFTKDRTVPFWPTFTKFVRLLDGHVMLAVMSPIVAFGGWIPMLVNLGTSASVVYTLPTVISVIQTIAVLGLAVTIWTSMKMLPERPEKYKEQRRILMVLQWVLMPLIAILYQSAAAFYAQTRLMTGNYMEKFDVTKKVIKK